jgi:hypothetical protein
VLDRRDEDLPFGDEPLHRRVGIRRTFRLDTGYGRGEGNGFPVVTDQGGTGVCGMQAMVIHPALGVAPGVGCLLGASLFGGVGTQQVMGTSVGSCEAGPAAGASLPDWLPRVLSGMKSSTNSGRGLPVSYPRGFSRRTLRGVGGLVRALVAAKMAIEPRVSSSGPVRGRPGKVVALSDLSGLAKKRPTWWQQDGRDWFRGSSRFLRQDDRSEVSHARIAIIADLVPV